MQSRQVRRAQERAENKEYARIDKEVAKKAAARPSSSAEFQTAISSGAWGGPTGASFVSGSETNSAGSGEGCGNAMQTFWMKFTDGTEGFCEGQGAYDAVQIAEKLSGKRVDLEDEFRYKPEKSPNVKTLPYPVENKAKGRGMIWQFEHPIHGKCPGFCGGDLICRGKTSCPQRYSCSE